MWRAGVASVRKGSQVSGRGGAFLEGVAWVWKGLRESRRGRLSPVEVRQVRKGSGESGRGQVSQEGVRWVRKGLRVSERGRTSLEEIRQVQKGLGKSGRGRACPEGINKRKLKKTAFFKPSCRENCSTDLKFGTQSGHLLKIVHAKFQVNATIFSAARLKKGSFFSFRWNLAWTIFRRCPDCVPNFKSLLPFFTAANLG